MPRTLETPVLIIGGGPVGLATALDLGWRGIQCMLIEQNNGVVDHPKLGMIAVRSMEFFRRWGIAKRIREAGFPDDYELTITFCTGLGGGVLDRDFYPSLRDMPQPSWSPEKKQRCPQLFLDPVLQKAVSEYPSVTSQVCWRLDSIEQFPDHVLAHVTDLRKQEQIDIRASYAIGCDGGGSLVRRSLGIEMLGNPKINYSMGILIRSKDLLKHFDVGEAERYIFVGPEGTWGNLTVVDGKDNWRLTVLGSEAKFDLDAFDAHKWVKRCLGRDDVPYEILSVLPWRRSELTSERYEDGRIFLVGDSAHTMSPTSGMGMNTGYGDVVDLGWKLDGVLRGWGTSSLLQTYGIERRPVAIRNAKFATHNWNSWVAPTNCAAILDQTPEGEQLRREVGGQMKDSLRVEWRSWGVQMGYRYEDSPICIPDGTPAPPDDFSDYVPTARPGSRAPHAELLDGRSTIDLFARDFTLLRFDGADPDSVEALINAARTKKLPLSVVSIDKPDIAQLYEQPLVLVRPDGHVAWRGADAGDAGRIVDTVRGVGITAH